MERNPFVGTWRLVSFEMIGADGSAIRPFGAKPVGYIMYSDDGYMSVAFMRPNRPRLSGERGRGTPEELVDALSSHFSYAGPYKVRRDRVIHYLDVCSSPNSVGLTWERTYEFEGNRLTLTADPDPAAGMRRTVRFVWERVAREACWRRRRGSR